ncbi:prenyltransferase [Thiomicrospira microaerophila]|uniref:prenyltransferase n=1 Tax=Thiomicrospira microaerophila TaxID=406020 RepID=UPI00200CD834|nr:prenyltransferase [Thiomicrospira microaerophila]UQB43391.1 prenyltransferase [Thiomicrospira microaerophila]
MIKAIFLTARPPFLLLTLSVITMAGALAHKDNAEFSIALFTLVLLGALAAHASVNMLNEAHDARSGLDELTQRTPFSGGSGALQDYPGLINRVEAIGLGLLGFVMTLGLYFIWLTGWGLLPIGLVGVGLVLAYTPKITRSPWLCLITPGLAFGPLMVMGSYYVLTGYYSCIALALSLIPFFLVNNLLLLNQYPDLAADRQVGRRNLVIAYGEKTGVRVFNLFLITSFVGLVALALTDCIPLWSLLGLLMLVLAIPLMIKLITSPHPFRPSSTDLASNVIINLATPALIALGLLIA